MTDFGGVLIIAWWLWLSVLMVAKDEFDRTAPPARPATNEEPIRRTIYINGAPVKIAQLPPGSADKLLLWGKILRRDTGEQDGRETGKTNAG